MKLVALAIMAIMMLPTTSAEISPAGNHSGVVGRPGIDEFLVNWTDNKNYAELKNNTETGPRVATGRPDVVEWDDQTTMFYLSAYEKFPENTTLMYDIYWHPGEKRPSSVKPDEYPFEILPDEIDLQSDVSVEGKKGVLFRLKEEKIYRGPDNPPIISESSFYVCYFPDEYTEVRIWAPTTRWTELELKSLLDSLTITPPKGYY
ncbi:hypothetical protein [Methanothrix sp.]|jgi:hypothetical protein|uniref:hypothetical protein n=1 Tax=Methanothrix sp. TaxID=90426 RepID=UPI003C752D2B